MLAVENCIGTILHTALKMQNSPMCVDLLDHGNCGSKSFQIDCDFAVTNIHVHGSECLNVQSYIKGISKTKIGSYHSRRCTLVWARIYPFRMDLTSAVAFGRLLKDTITKQ